MSYTGFGIFVNRLLVNKEKRRRLPQPNLEHVIGAQLKFIQSRRNHFEAWRKRSTMLCNEEKHRAIDD
ncbi:unnamed protein product [Sphenostylis stenocarpa]|uniref:Uncharacterized protein n=1 Tax=Sphenostylis stenocarpa TaxID=92480 RepID=A0AA86T196_9FABA|nr:unnamed protein product [Sphenostylis stenocarpa]